MSEVISAEAIEAAARVVYHSSGRYRVVTYRGAHAECQAEALAILEAAAPHMLARAYNAGHLDGMTGAPNQNPYRVALQSPTQNN